MFKASGFVVLGLFALVCAVRQLVVRHRRSSDDPKIAELLPKAPPIATRTWDVSRDHDDPRARRQLMAEVKARRVQAERSGKDGSNVSEFPRRRA